MQARSIHHSPMHEGGDGGASVTHCSKLEGANQLLKLIVEHLLAKAGKDLASMISNHDATVRINRALLSFDFVSSDQAAAPPPQGKVGYLQTPLNDVPQGRDHWRDAELK